MRMTENNMWGNAKAPIASASIKPYYYNWEHNTRSEPDYISHLALTY